MTHTRIAEVEEPFLELSTFRMAELGLSRVQRMARCEICAAAGREFFVTFQPWIAMRKFTGCSREEHDRYYELFGSVR